MPVSRAACRLLLAVSVFLAAPEADAAEPAASPWPAKAPQAGEDKPGTLAVGIVVDRDGASIVGNSPKVIPFRAHEPAAPRGWQRGRPLQIEVVLQSGASPLAVVRVDRPGICFDHGAGEPAHIAGDTIELHRESLLVELPDLPGADRISVAWYDAALARRPLGELALGGAPRTPGTVHWPEEYSDPDIYTVHGSEAEAARRINVVLVPDGYVYAEKALMQTHAQEMVDWFRAKTPYAEHDAFFNYILVYAYSTESGTDQCDCSIVLDTAMRTRFPDHGSGCGHSDHRCLYYGTGNGGPSCDPVTADTNIAAAELRAPAHDVTIVMVNTTRYGGCGGSRAVYSAANSSAVEVAVHELGHTLAGLADEYAYSSGCGSQAGEVNTSLDGTNGAWAEWIADLGAPREGAQYWQSCIFRPESTCEMQALGVPFCAVCNQHWSLQIFGHPNVSPTAPIESQQPTSPVTVNVGDNVTFSVVTRLGSGTTNDLTWTLTPPGTVVATGTDTHNETFPTPGVYTLTCEVVADTNFVKPVRNDENVDTATWSITVSQPGCTTITVDPPTLPDAYVGLPYSQTLTASGGTAPYAFTVTNGTLPPSLTLATNGLLSGTPTSPGGTFNFTVTATDATSCIGSRSYTLSVIDGGCGITISPATLPTPEIGIPYSAQLAAAGGFPPYTFSVATGSLPAGLALSGSGLLSGTPTTSGQSDFVIDAVDARSCIGSRSYTLHVGDLHVAGCGFGAPNPNRVRLYDGAGVARPTDFFAYAAGTWGVNVSSGDLDAPPAEILTGPGPGVVFGPQSRGFRGDGTPMGKVNYYAYGTLRYGVNVSGADADGDGVDEILNGPGEGAVFGPHVRGYDVDGGVATAIPSINFFAYGTLRYGVLVGAGDVESDGFAELLTGPGPGVVFGPQVRGFDWDGGPLTAMPNVNFNAFAVPSYGVGMDGGDVDGDGVDEIAAAVGPGPSHPASFAGFDVDGGAVSPLQGFTDTPFTTLYGARVGLGAVAVPGVDLVEGAGRDPAASSDVLSKEYSGSALLPLANTFTPFPPGHGVNVGPGGIGI